MVVQELTFADLVVRLGPLAVDWQETVVPARIEALPSNRYRPDYGWMFTFERRLKERIEAAIGRRLERTTELRLFGADGVLSEALSNAFVHGHRRDATRGIAWRCAVAADGLACEVVDGGAGFDVAATVARATAGGTYFHHAGNGLRALIDDDLVEAGWSDGGRRLALLVWLPVNGGGGASTPTRPQP
jgi:hypothetical protein